MSQGRIAFGASPITIGVAENRKPYSFINESREAQGVLVERIKAICEAIKSECIFSFADYFGNLDKLHQLKLDVMLVIDTAVIIESDEVLLSRPLCNPDYFILYRGGGRKTGKEALKGLSIGALYESQTHLHLLDNFYDMSRISPYSVLESAVFDLQTNRLDAVVMEGGFFHGRVAKHNILDENMTSSNENQLSITSDKLVKHSMRLAVKSSNEKLLTRLNEGFIQLGDTVSCGDLLKTSGTNQD